MTNEIPVDWTSLIRGCAGGSLEDIVAEKSDELGIQPPQLDFSTRRGRLYLVFETDADALMFKLRWL